MMQKIIIIPDVHGRKFWRRAIEEEADCLDCKKAFILENNEIKEF